MYFIKKIKELLLDKEAIIFVDMDGVITDYNFNQDLNFNNKRPIITNINTLKQVSLLKNVDLYILSICIYDKEIKEKNDWLNKYAPFFEERNRVIISKESNPNISSKALKLNYLKNYISTTTKKIVLIDDDNAILKYISDNLDDKVVLFQDSSIVD